MKATAPSSNPIDQNAKRSILAWTVLPLAFFPLVALLTYDWHAISALNTPAAATTNWIGALGDGFAYYGYHLFGLAIWIVPVVCMVGTVNAIRSGKIHNWRRGLWLLLLITSVASVLQVVGGHAGPIADTVRRLNIMNAGGCIGHLLMTRLLSPLISDFGSAVLMTMLIVISLLASIGLGTIARFFTALSQWAMPAPRPRLQPATDDDAVMAFPDPREEKERIRAQKEAARQAAREEKERLKAEKAAAKQAEREARGHTSFWSRESTPPIQPLPVRAETMPQAAAVETSAQTVEDKGPYLLPTVALLKPLKKSSADHGDVGQMSQKLIDTLKLFGVDAMLAYTVQGPVVTKYALKLAPGIRYSAVTNISDNLMGALHAKSLRIEAPIPGEECVGIEVPNRAPAGISFREVFESEAWRNFKGELPLLFGKDAAGKELIADLASMPHMLVAGATGQGKSVCLNAIINGLLMTKTPDQLKLIMVDPKSVEFTSYASLPHLIVPVITENKKVVFSLHWAVAEMEKRLKLFARARVRNIHDFNHRPQLTQTDMFGADSEVGSNMPKTVPYIVIIIDEVADLMSTNGKEVVPDIARLTAKARAAGIHLILATQRPDAKVITGTIKANIPGRVAFKTATSIDSRTILDDGGAENLIGRGDMLFKSKDGLLIRAQGAWISDEEIENIITFIEQHSNVQFDQRFAKKLGTIKEEEIDIFDDDNDGSDSKAKAKEEAASQREQVKAEENASDFKKAIECIINTNRASTSHFQRKLGWGYNHSAKIMDMLEDAGIIAPQSGAGPRSIIMDQQQLIAIFNGDAAASAAGADEPAAEPPADEEALPVDDTETAMETSA